MKRAVIYARFSSSAQREESIDTQIRECTAFARSHDMLVVGTYEDRAKSGRTSNRPGFQKMIRDSEKKIFDAVILYTIDRFARNRFDAATYRAKLKANGVTLYYAKQNLGDGAESILLESLMEGYAEYYSASLSRSVKAGMEENAIHGKSNGAYAPLGYKVGKDRMYEIEPVEAEIVKLIFQMYANGYSAASVARNLNERGYRTRAGKLFSRRSFTKILKNEKYTGVYIFDDHRIDGGMPRIISKELFDKVQARRKEVHKVKARYKAKEIYFLTPTLYCGHCGEPMYGESGTGKSGQVYTYYKCKTRKNGGDCKKRNEKKAQLEDFVIDMVVQHIFTDEMIEHIADRTVSLIEKNIREDPEIIAVEKRIRELKTFIDNGWRAVDNGLNSAGYINHIHENEAELGHLEHELTRLKLAHPPLTKEMIIYFLSKYKEKEASSDELRNFICSSIIHRVDLLDTEAGTLVTVICNVVDPQTDCEPGCSDLDSLVHQCRRYSNTVQVFPEQRRFGLASITN